MFQFAIIATTIEFTLCLACSVLLWMRRRETGDWSRHVLAAASFYNVLTSLFKYQQYIVWPDNNIYTELLEPSHCIGGLFSLITFFFYPVVVMRLSWFTWRRVLLLLLPWALMAPPYVLGIDFLSLNSVGELTGALTDFSVWWRLLTVGIILLYLVLLLLLPFNWQQSSADSSWVRRYTLAIALMAALYFGYQLTLWMPVHLVHQVYVGLFFVYYTYFELEERLLPAAEENTTPPSSPDSDSGDGLWQCIRRELDEKQAWKNPELTVEGLALLVGSNKTYVHQAFATHGGTNYKDYVNRRRVEFIASELRSKPNQNLESLFYRAGYRSRTTAGRNFKDIMGVSPSDYAASL